MAAPYVLIVEDSVPDAELARVALLELDPGLEVGVARNASEAFSQLKLIESRGNAPQPLLIWLDLRLPEMDGIAMLKQLRNRRATAAVPVILFSGSKEADQVDAGLAAGANAYVHKPDDVDLYLRRISEVTRAFLTHTIWPQIG